MFTSIFVIKWKVVALFMLYSRNCHKITSHKPEHKPRGINLDYRNCTRHFLRERNIFSRNLLNTYRRTTRIEHSVDHYRDNQMRDCYCVKCSEQSPRKGITVMVSYSLPLGRDTRTKSFEKVIKLICNKTVLSKPYSVH